MKNIIRILTDKSTVKIIVLRWMFALAGVFFFLPVRAQDITGVSTDSLIFEDQFSDLNNWVIETPRNPQSSVVAKNHKLVIDVAKGATVWLRQPLSGNMIISYKRKVIDQGGKNDRVSDLNQFWMAKDPRDNNIFTRNGVFGEYDSLRMYYFGYGGNRNTTSRFRKYEGNGEKKILKEYNDPAHLLIPEKVYLIQTVIQDGKTEVFFDGEKVFSFQDDHPLTSGYFGFRTTESRQEISEFKVFRLKE